MHRRPSGHPLSAPIVAASVAILVPLVVLMTIGCAPGPPRRVGSPVPATEGGEAMQAAPLPGCGDDVAALAAAAGPLAMTGAFPGKVDRAGPPTFTGTVTLTAGRGVTGVTSPEADVYVTRSGTVVATPLPKDLVGVPVRLVPGASRQFPATGSLRECSEGGGPAGGEGRMLPAGRYEVFAAVVVTDDAGSSVLAVGGPWPVEVT